MNRRMSPMSAEEVPLDIGSKSSLFEVWKIQPFGVEMKILQASERDIQLLNSWRPTKTSYKHCPIFFSPPWLEVTWSNPSCCQVKLAHHLPFIIRKPEQCWGPCWITLDFLWVIVDHLLIHWLICKIWLNQLTYMEALGKTHSPWKLLNGYCTTSQPYELYSKDLHRWKENMRTFTTAL